jgi:hypothetical protein
MQPMQPMRALTGSDLELLRLAGAANTLKASMNAMLVVVFAFTCGLMSWAVLSGETYGDNTAISTNVALVSLALALAVSFWMWRQWRRTIRPLRAAIEHNEKRIVCGTLTRVEMLPKGRLRYIVDGAAVEVDLLLGVDSRASYMFRRPLDSFLHLTDVAVELHCIALGPDITMLLQAHYPLTPQPTRTERPVDGGDQDRATNEAKSTASTTTGCLFAVLLLIGLALRFATGSTKGAVLGTAALGLCMFAILPFVVLPRLLRARRSTGVVAIEGPVTEIIKSQVRYGKTASSFDVSWYRVGGVLYCPFGAGAEGKADLGQFVKFEFMTGKGRTDNGKLMYFQGLEMPNIIGGADEARTRQRTFVAWVMPM